MAIAPESNLKSLADGAPKRALAVVEMIGGHVEDLPAFDAAFDAAMASLAFARSGIRPLPSREVGGVLRPGGCPAGISTTPELRFLGNVHAATPRAQVQRAIDANVWP